MSGDVVIRAEGLGKKYLIGHQAAERGGTLRDAIVRGAGNFARMGKAMLRGQQIIAGDEIEEFWALRDVDFEIRRGDVVGVIGRNGAGKSTLLKVLSRITEPSEGRVTIKGRIASLLEVGTGFHPELSGRENIYLNGAILGMSRAEIRRKFDEIVAFAEVEKFLDTPVKRYSSGMYVRLAFSVAAHLEPEILIVDEVLAVGDAQFQQKCLGKMQDVAGEGRTVLFVSHNIQAIQRLCRSGLVLIGGRRDFFGSANAAIQKYLERRPDSNGDGPFPAIGMSFDIRVGEEQILFENGNCGLILEIFSSIALSGISIEIVLKDSSHTPILFLNSGTTNDEQRIDIPTGISTWQVRFNADNIASGTYGAIIKLVEPGEHIFVERERDGLFSFAFSPPPQRLPFCQSWGIGCIEAPLSVKQNLTGFISP